MLNLLLPFLHITASFALSADRIVELTRRSSLRSWDGGEELGWVVERRVQAHNNDLDSSKDRLEVSVGVSSTAEDDEDILKVDIPSDVNGGVSSSLWPSALAGSVLLRRGGIRSALANKHIVELGSGLGLAGLVAASAPANSVELTDKVDAALELLADTVKRNSFDDCHLTSRKLDWKETETYGDDQADIIIGTDLAYYFFLLRPLMNASRACMKQEHGLMYIIGQGNRESQWDFFNNIRKGCYNQITDEQEPPWEGETKMILYNLKIGRWDEDSFNGGDKVQEEVPIAVLVHATEEGRISELLEEHDHIATKADEENQMYTF